MTDIRGVGVVTAAMIIGHVGDVSRFRSAAHFASYNGTAPIEASSGERRRHRLNPRGNRQLNYAIHVVAITQLRYPCEGREYYDRKRAEGVGRIDGPARTRRARSAARRECEGNTKKKGSPEHGSHGLNLGPCDPLT